MLFSGALFLFVFLPCVLLLYYILPEKAKNPFLLAASLLFYLSSDPASIFLLLFTAFMNYAFALVIARKKKYAKAALSACLIIDFSLLFFFKYAHFFLSPLFGEAIPEPALPAGISFYIFQASSYTIDVYRGDCRCEGSFPTFATYLCLFPQLIAGPIVRYSDVEDSMHERGRSIKKFSDGVILFTVGLAKKVIIADSLFLIELRYSESAQRDVLFAWLYAISFTLRIYFDFSGYTDMARGLGKMLGFEFPENFRHPYAAKSITDFWRRWHITLSSWFKSYVYIPLGGNRCSKARCAFNIAVVWTLTGLWHGANLTFIVWGGLYALLLITEKMLFPAAALFFSRLSWTLRHGRPSLATEAAHEAPYEKAAGENAHSQALPADSAPSKIRSGGAIYSSHDGSGPTGAHGETPTGSSPPYKPYEKKKSLGLASRLVLSSLGHIYTMFFVVCGFVVFNADSLSTALSTLSDMLFISGAPLTSDASEYYLKSYILLILSAAVLSLPLKEIASSLLSRIRRRKGGYADFFGRLSRRGAFSFLFALARPVAVASGLLVCLFFIIGGSYKPFLYFRF